MNKRILLCSALAAVAVGSLSLRSYGQTGPAPVTCHTLYRSSFSSEAPTLIYDVRTGITLSGRSSGFSSFTGTVPLTIGGEPNPHFDRLYALLMKGAEGRLDQVCVEGSNSASGAIASVTLMGAMPSATQKVEICNGGGDCASVGSGRLMTRSN